MSTSLLHFYAMNRYAAVDEDGTFSALWSEITKEEWSTIRQIEGTLQYLSHYAKGEAQASKVITC